MSQPIEAGLMDMVGKVFKRFGNAITRGLTNLSEAGIEISKNQFQQTNDGGLMFMARTGAGSVIKVKCVPVPERDGYFNMYVKSKDGKKKAYPMIRTDQFDDKMLHFIENVMKEDAGLEDNYSDAQWEGRDRDYRADFDVNEGDGVNESKRIKATFRKVTSSKETRVDLVAINANYYPKQALADLQTVVGDDAFVDTLSAEPVTVVITPEENELDVQTTDAPVDTKSTCVALLYSAYTALFNLQAVHWNVSGKQFMRLHTMMDEYLEKIREQIDRIAEIALETNANIPNPVEIVKSLQVIAPSNNFDGQEGARYAIAAIQQFIDALELFYVNVPHEVQSEYDEWIGYWNTEAKFKLPRI